MRRPTLVFGINEGTLTLGNGTNGGLASNYTLTGHAASSFQVTQRVLSSSGSRIYDGSTTEPVQVI